MESKSFTKKYFFKLISNAISMLSGFLVAAIVPRSIGPAAFGAYSLITDLLSQMFTLVESGSSSALFNKISQDHKNLHVFKKYAKFIFVVNALFILSILAMYYTQILKTLNLDLEFKTIVLGFAFASCLWTNTIYTKVLDALGLTARLEKIRILVAVLKSVSIVTLFLIQKITFVNFMILQILPLALINFIFLRIIFKSMSPGNSIGERIFPYFVKYSAPLLIYGILSSSGAIFDRMILQKFGGLAHQGMFGLASQLSLVCFLFTSSVIPLFHRELSILTHSKSHEKIQKLVDLIFPILFLGSCILSGFAAVNSSEIIELIAGKSFILNQWGYTLMFLYPIHQTYGQLIGTLYYSSGETKLYASIGSILLLFGFAATYLFIATPDFGGLGLGFLGLSLKYFALQILNVHVLMYFIFRKLNLSASRHIFNQFLILSLFIGAALLSKISVSSIFNSNNSNILFICNLGFYFTLCFSILGLTYIFNIPLLLRDSKEKMDKISKILIRFGEK